MLIRFVIAFRISFHVELKDDLIRMTVVEGVELTTMCEDKTVQRHVKMSVEQVVMSQRANMVLQYQCMMQTTLMFRDRSVPPCPWENFIIKIANMEDVRAWTRKALIFRFDVQTRGPSGVDEAN